VQIDIKGGAEGSYALFFDVLVLRIPAPDVEGGGG